MHIDVCHGDADGLCAVLQWRLQWPCAARLVTGLKREIQLLDAVQAGPGDELLVCDLSMRRNHQALLRLLQAGAHVTYFDHHAVDAIPAHALLDAHIDVASDVCTSMLVDRHLAGRFRAWAVVGAFGDGLGAAAWQLADSLGLAEADIRSLRTLGEAISYNAYGDSAADVQIPPHALYDILRRFANPLALLQQHRIGAELDATLQADMQQARALGPYFQDQTHAVYLFPDAAWSRRVMGNFANRLAAAQAQRALALLRPTAQGDYVVSVRAPQIDPTGAAAFCRRFGGDGRAAAAGIDRLPASQLWPFVDAFVAAPWHTQAHPGGAA